MDGFWWTLGSPIYVQRAELEDARTQPDYTIPEWVEPPTQTLNYVSIDGDHELLPGVWLLHTPGHTRGSQVVAVDTIDGLGIIAGDTAVWSGELDEPQTEGQHRIVALRPWRVWFSHQDTPWSAKQMTRAERCAASFGTLTARAEGRPHRSAHRHGVRGGSQRVQGQEPGESRA